MTPIQKMRLFIAASLPETTRLQIEATVAPLRSRLPAASWTRAESFHLTLAFLGDLDESVIQPLSVELDTRLSEERAFDLTAAGAGFFPDQRRSRVAWIGLEPREPLIRVAALVRDAVRGVSLAFDEKPFAPHLTLARLRARWSRQDVDQFLSRLSDFRSEPARLDAVTLFQSQLSSKGAIHTPLHRVLLNPR